MCFALGEMTARKNAQPKQKRLRIQLLPGDYMSKVRNIFCRPEQPERGVKKGIIILSISPYDIPQFSLPSILLDIVCPKIDLKQL
jgi:hypothetical protein